MSTQPELELLNNFTDQTIQDLTDLSRHQTKISAGRILSTEPEEYCKNERQKRLQKNSHRSQNGYSLIASGITGCNIMQRFSGWFVA